VGHYKPLSIIVNQVKTPGLPHLTFLPRKPRSCICSNIFLKDLHEKAILTIVFILSRTS
jgi:hypothetical protein